MTSQLLHSPDPGLNLLADEGASAQLDLLKQRLIATGYTEYLSAFDPYVYDVRLWAAYESTAFPALRPVLHFFALCLPVSEELLDAALGTSWRILTTLGIANVDERGFARISDYVLL